MSLFLRERDTELREFMDDPDCDIDTLYTTYDQFKTVNKLIGGWRRIYRHYIRPALKDAGSNASILDIGCGGGDVLGLLNTYCRDDNLDIQITGIEPDARAIDYVRKQNWPDNFTFLNSFSHDLVKSGETFTVVISNHLIHHLTPQELENVSSDAESLANRRVIFSDIERSDVGYISFRTLAPLLFKNSFIAEDGERSIRRSYQKEELSDQLPDGWRVERQFPFRLLAIYDGGSA